MRDKESVTQFFILYGYEKRVCHYSSDYAEKTERSCSADYARIRRKATCSVEEPDLRDV